MIAHAKSKKFDPEEDETAYFETTYKNCRRCKQEYTGACPISFSGCPMEAAENGDEEDEEKDFDDVGNLKEVLKDDEEADKLTDEDDEIPEDARRDD